jgi:hypothetical protein
MKPDATPVDKTARRIVLRQLTDAELRREIDRYAASVRADQSWLAAMRREQKRRKRKPL